MTQLKQKYSCERSEWALCTLMNKYKKKYCYNYMPSFTDETTKPPACKGPSGPDPDKSRRLA